MNLKTKYLQKQKLLKIARIFKSCDKLFSKTKSIKIARISNNYELEKSGKQNNSKKTNSKNCAAF